VLRTIYRHFRQKSAISTQSIREDQTHAGTPEHQSDDLWEDEWRRYHVQRALAAIESEFSEMNRLAFLFSTVRSQPVQGVAEALGISVDQVYQAKSRILKRVAELVEQQVKEEG
jgi:DNA-directed RNA polymerase specialized sigma24 family protein